jgi:hypothetical protein
LPFAVVITREPRDGARRSGRAAAGDDPRTRGRAQQLRRGGDRTGRRRGRLELRGAHHVRRRRLNQQVERHLDVPRARPLRPERRERRRQLPPELRVAHHAHAALHHAGQRPLLAGHLVQVAGRGDRMRARHAGRDHQQRHRVRLGLPRRGGDVEQRRPRRGDDDARAARRARIAVGRVAGALLVARQDVPDPVAIELRVELQVVRAGDAEDELDVMRGEAAHDQLARAEGFAHGGQPTTNDY